MLTLVEDHERDGIRVRVVACDCDAAKGTRQEVCGTRFIIGQYNHEQLWLCCGMCAVGDTDHQVEFLLDDDELGGSRPSIELEHGIAMLGLTWPVVSSSRAVAIAQLTAYDKVPPWMCRLPIDLVWSCRRLVFGNDLTRVPRALFALNKAYVQEAPALEPWRS